MHPTRGVLSDPARSRPSWPVLVVVGCLGLACFGRLWAADLVDRFDARETATSKSGAARGDSSGASVEPFEPRHGRRTGGHSLWMSWTAPSTGIATFETTGSDFDTLLSVYLLEAGNPDKPPLDRLREVARADDRSSSLGKQVQFGVRGGTTYEIAVDGYDGATGDARLRWDLLATDDPLPVILALPPDRALRVGDDVTLTVALQAGDDVKLAWLLNGDDVLGAESDTLTIPNFQLSNVGRYQLRITSGAIRFTSDPIELQVNSEGEISALARDRLLDAVDSPLVGRGVAPALASGTKASPARRARALANVGVSRGYNGVQVFHTIQAAREPGEPVHCGVSGGASYWFVYQPPARGTLTLDTDGSSFDTVLAVYTYDAPLVGYASLRSVVCDDNGGGAAGTSRVQFDAEPGRSYLVAVDGVNGARGRAHLNYRLATSPRVDPPLITMPPSARSVVMGEAVTFEVIATGTAPLAYQWLRDGAELAGATAATLTLGTVQVTDAGAYSVRVSNEAGVIVSATALLTVREPPLITTPPSARSVVVGEAVTFEVVASGTAPLAYQWLRDGAELAGATAVTLTLGTVQVMDAGAYSVRVSNEAGVIVSATALLTVLEPPTITTPPSARSVVMGEAVTFEVVASGSAPLAYQWLRDGAELAGATAVTLTLGAVQLTDAGAYSVRVSNEAGVIVSATALLTVREPPWITTPPSTRSVVMGEAVTFEVVATGSAPLAYQWLRDGAELAGATAVTLTLGAVQVTDAGAYSVRVSNGAGVIVSATALLTVREPPLITTPPFARSVVVGEAVTFEVVATGTAPLAYQWLRDGAELAGATAATLTLGTVQVTDAGAYSVRVSNEAGVSVSGTASLVVGAVLRIARDPASGSLVLELPSAPGRPYVLESTDAAAGGRWSEESSGVATGDRVRVVLEVGRAAAGYFRFSTRTPAGAGFSRSTTP